MSTVQEFNTFVKRLKIFQPSPTIYDSISGFSEFGPYGTTIKSNLIQAMRKAFRKAEFWEVEHPIVLPKNVWKASGHLDRFVDIIAESDGKVYRIDKIIEEQYPEIALTNGGLEYLSRFIQEHDIIPKGNTEPLHDAKEYNLMMMTSVAGEEAGLRPETATATYLSFKDYYTLLRNTMPIKVFQYGKAFRNEVTSRQGLIRGREFEQLEAQMFVLQEHKHEFPQFDNVKQMPFLFWSSAAQQQENPPERLALEHVLQAGVLSSPAYAYCLAVMATVLETIGLDQEHVRLRQHLPDEKAHYAIDAWDVEVKTEQYGWVEICGVHDRGTYDLGRHQEYSNKPLSIKNHEGENEIPNLLEIAFGIGRTMYCLLELSFRTREGKNVLSLPKILSPIHAAIFPLVKKDGLIPIAQKLNERLLDDSFISVYDEKGSIGKRYARMDEIGTPYCVTIDHQTLDHKRTRRNEPRTDSYFGLG
jgi:glycyl-tRNA synthetase